MFSPDYKELHILRKIFPRVPIMALSATCGPHVLKDLINILGLREPVDGTSSYSFCGSIPAYFDSCVSQMLLNSGPFISHRLCIEKIYTILWCQSQTKPNITS
jgi:superfamily II DNA helicase RecQ